VRVVVDTGPLLAAANRRDKAHALAAPIVQGLGRDLVIPTTVLVETDQLVRTRVGANTARSFLDAVSSGSYSVAFLTPGLIKRAVAIDADFADLDLGFVDATVMAIAERHELPIFTFDFEDFRAAAPRRRPWRLLVDEARYVAETDR
jgi:uncharacterized protein